MMRLLLILLPLLGLCLTGCTATMARYCDETAVTVQAEVKSTQSLDIPVRFFKEELPERYQHKGLGIINDQETFLKMWNLYAKEATVLPPSVDFRDYVLIFVYDPNYYNHVEIIGLNVWQGIANPIVRKTDWKLSIEGNQQMRKIREAEGAKLPEPKVNVAFQQVPRHRPGQSGVTALMVEGNADDPGESLVIPIPEKP
ncbi:MAG: hypothetical protein IJV69_03025 [Kiritimatiellae bacterium]|nr:hypothetical protein [Kiritimatiellia bacterium]